MSAIYHNWEKLVAAVKKREDWRESACGHSRNPSTFSDSSSDSDLSLESMSELVEEFDLPAPDEFVTEEPFVRSWLRRDLSISKPKYIVEERNGKMCYMAGVRQLLILTQRASQFWGWTTRADSRFSQVAVLHYGRCLDIRGRIKTRLLSADTFYAAYLVFKLTAWSKGLESVDATVNFFDEESDRDAQERAHSVYLQHSQTQWGSYAARRIDGWMEVEIGNFYVDGQDKAVEARILEYNSWKTGLIVEGIEFRPLASESTSFSSQWGYHLVPVNSFENDSIKFPDFPDFPDFPPLPSGASEADKGVMVTQKEDAGDIEFDMSLLQEFVPEFGSDIKFSPSPALTTMPPIYSDAESKENSVKRMKQFNRLESCSDISQAVDHVTEARSGQANGSKRILEPASDTNLGFCQEWNIKDSCFRDNGVGGEMMAKSLLPQDESLLDSFSRDELFSGGFDRLSELVNIFHGMKRMVERKEMEADDLKQKLIKSEVEAQLALAEKDSELEELRRKVRKLKVEAVKAHANQKEEKNKANEKIEEVERKLEACEARATSAVEEYKNSEELKVEKHKFASKAFSIGFQFCVKQVLEVDPRFDTRRIDVKRLEGPSSSIVKI